MKNFKIVVAHPEVKVQLFEDATLVTEKIMSSDRSLSVHLLEAIDSILSEQKLKGTDINDLIVHEETPSFSATRTATITAQMLKESWGM